MVSNLLWFDRVLLWLADLLCMFRVNAASRRAAVWRRVVVLPFAVGLPAPLSARIRVQVKV